MSEPQKRRPAWRPFVHAGRVLILVAIALIIHLAATLHAPAHDGPAPVLDIAIVQKLFPTADHVADDGTVKDAANATLGRVLQTSPAGDKAIGFSGPTNVLIGFSTAEKISGLAILSSRDTREHAREVERHAPFLHSLDGLTRDEAIRQTDIDAVSGATLTSLAMIEAVQRRLGGGQKSLKFPDLPKLGIVRKLFPAAQSLEPDEIYPSLLIVKNGDATSLGKILRTSPAADNLVGYQGPTEMLVGLDNQDIIIGMALVRSYDNEPYIDYVREDEYFLNLLNGQSIYALPETDLRELQIEGVSGATMTSQTAATGVYYAADDMLQSYLARNKADEKDQIRLRERDYKTIAVVIVGVLLAFSPWRGKPWARIPFQIVVFVYLGFANGDFVSQALLVGWAQNGVPWKLAIGLVLLVGAALALPIFTRTNVYCSHLCPHGVVQQWTKRRIKWQWKPSKKLLPWLKAIPSVLLAWVVLVAAARWSFSLVDIEPFDAYVWHIAGWGTIGVAVVGLVASLFTPMAYCRFGCPTGALLDYVRYNGKSEFWTRRDWVAVGLLALGAVALLF
ncbi:FMN-binding protein [Blastopirellula marina]|uniref:Probable NosR regulatory protein n=1 Tax=Blastopirellula marina DSM 3645 TaxID=314230 RepID=A3ZL27_9BACT|nr:FMN-binding protein [Blastopirellula marina]EAQ82460.1 probable NosR regulatory protein [Blastopirellula marina DSM 3645]